MRFFGGIAAGLIVPGVGLEVFLLIHYLRTGEFTPHKWAGFTGGALLLLGLGMLLMAVLGDMLNRHRLYLEELLYLNRLEAWRHNHDSGGGTDGPGCPADAPGESRDVLSGGADANPG